MEKKFEPFHCQMDYETNVAEVQFEGNFDVEEAIRYAKLSYPNIKGEVLYLHHPEEVKGYTNLGVAGIV